MPPNIGKSPRQRQQSFPRCGKPSDSNCNLSQHWETFPTTKAISPNIGTRCRQKSSISQDWDTYYFRCSTFPTGGKHKSQQKQISPLKGTSEYPQNKFPLLKGNLEMAKRPLSLRRNHQKHDNRATRDISTLALPQSPMANEST